MPRSCPPPLSGGGIALLVAGACLAPRGVAACRAPPSNNVDASPHSHHTTCFPRAPFISRVAVPGRSWSENGIIGGDFGGDGAKIPFIKRNNLFT